MWRMYDDPAAKQRCCLARNLQDLEDGLGRLGKLPRDVRRSIVAPMIIYPYGLVGINDSRDALLTLGDASYLGPYKFAASSHFARTPGGWITVADTRLPLGQMVVYIGAHGEHCVDYIQCDQITTGSQRYYIDFPDSWSTPGGVRIGGPMSITYSIAHDASLEEAPEYSTLYLSEMVEDALFNAKLPQDRRPVQVVLLDEWDGKITLIIHNGSRDIIKVVCNRELATVTATKKLDVTPLYVCFADGDLCVTWPWGATSIIAFFGIHP